MSRRGPGCYDPPMPTIELNADQTAIVSAHEKVWKRIEAEAAEYAAEVARRIQRLQVKSMNRQGRLQREAGASHDECLVALAKSLGVPIPNGAFVGTVRPGVAVVSWDGPDPRKQAEQAQDRPKDQPPSPPEKEATITPMPVGASNGAGHQEANP